MVFVFCTLSAEMHGPDSICVGNTRIAIPYVSVGGCSGVIIYIQTLKYSKHLVGLFLLNTTHFQELVLLS